MFEQLARQLKRRWAGISATLLLLAFIAGGLAQIRIDTSLASFVPKGDPAYTALQHRDRDFGGDPVVVLLRGNKATGLLLDQSQLVRMVGLEGGLSRLDNVAVVYGPATVLNQTAKDVQNVVLQISGRRDALENAALDLAKNQGKDAAAQKAFAAKALRTFDRRYGALIAKAMPMGLPTLKNARFVAKVLFDDRGNPRAQWKFLVPNTRSAAVLVRPRAGLDEQETTELVAAIKKTVSAAGLDVAEVQVTGVPVLTSSVAKQAKREVPLLGGLAFIAVGLVFLLSPWSRRRRVRLRPLLVALAGTSTTLAGFGWLDRPVSLGVVAFLPILLGIGSDFPLYLSQRSSQRGTLVAAGAAVAGFSALALSPLPFVRELGLALAGGLVVTCLFGLAAQRWLPRIEPRESDGNWVPPGRAVAPRVRRAVLAAGVLLSVAGWSALPSLQIQASPEELAKGLPELAQAQAVEKTLGFAGEVTVVTHAENVLTPEALRWARTVETGIVEEHGDQMRPILTVGSLLGFLGDQPTPEQVQAATNLLPPYLLGAVVTADSSTGAMVFGVDLTDVRAQSRLLDEVSRGLPPKPAGLSAEVVGLPVVAARGLELISANRLLINVLGVLAAGLVLVVGLRWKWDALRAVATVMIATGWVFGIAWLLGGTITPLTVAVGTLITVTGCEFAVVLATAARQRQYWLRRSVATAALAGTVGYATLAFSDLALLHDFGLLLAASVSLSYSAAVLVVWAAAPQVSDLPEQQPEAVALPTRTLESART